MEGHDLSNKACHECLPKEKGEQICGALHFIISCTVRIDYGRTNCASNFLTPDLCRGPFIHLITVIPS